MPIQPVRTKLSLTEWARILGVNPVHFAGVQVGAIQRVSCDVAWPQYSWQAADRVSREDVAREIAKAEAELEKALGYRLLPSFEVAEQHPTVRPNEAALFNWDGRGLRQFRKSVNPSWGYIVSPGVEAQELLEEDAPIVWSSTYYGDADYEDTATVTVTVDAGTAACEIHAYYPGHGGDPLWEIRPVEVAVVGTTATITFRRELAILASLLTRFDGDAIDGTDDASFLEAVDVYRVYLDPSTQATLIWEPVRVCDCENESGCPSCEFRVQTACLMARGEPSDAALAYEPAEWDADTESFTIGTLAARRDPDAIRLYYLAGWQDPTADCPRRTLDPQWATVIARLAASRLDRSPCSCSTGWWERWAEDLAFIDGAGELSRYRVDENDLYNVFGTRRGEIAAWRAVRAAGGGGNQGYALV